MALETWTLDSAHSGIHFTIRHMVISKVRGQFAKFAADVKFDPSQLAATTASVNIDVASIATGVADRDGHLKSKDFFDVATHPSISFVSTSLKPTGGEQFVLTGALTMHGVTRTVTLEGEYGGVAKDPWGNEKAGFTLKGQLNRKDYGLAWNQALETGGVLVGEQVELNIELELVRAK